MSFLVAPHPVVADSIWKRRCIPDLVSRTISPGGLMTAFMARITTPIQRIPEWNLWFEPTAPQPLGRTLLLLIVSLISVWLVPNLFSRWNQPVRQNTRVGSYDVTEGGAVRYVNTRSSLVDSRRGWRESNKPLLAPIKFNDLFLWGPPADFRIRKLSFYSP